MAEEDALRQPLSPERRAAFHAMAARTGAESSMAKVLEELDGQRGTFLAAAKARSLQDEALRATLQSLQRVTAAPPIPAGVRATEELAQTMAEYQEAVVALIGDLGQQAADANARAERAEGRERWMLWLTILGLVVGAVGSAAAVFALT